MKRLNKIPKFSTKATIISFSITFALFCSIIYFIKPNVATNTSNILSKDTTISEIKNTSKPEVLGSDAVTNCDATCYNGGIRVMIENKGDHYALKGFNNRPECGDPSDAGLQVTYTVINPDGTEEGVGGCYHSRLPGAQYFPIENPNGTDTQKYGYSITNVPGCASPVTPAGLRAKGQKLKVSANVINANYKSDLPECQAYKDRSCSCQEDKPNTPQPIVVPPVVEEPFDPGNNIDSNFPPIQGASDKFIVSSFRVDSIPDAPYAWYYDDDETDFYSCKPKQTTEPKGWVEMLPPGAMKRVGTAYYSFNLELPFVRHCGNSDSKEDVPDHPGAYGTILTPYPPICAAIAPNQSLPGEDLLERFGGKVEISGGDYCTYNVEGLGNCVGCMNRLSSINPLSLEPGRNIPTDYAGFQTGESEDVREYLDKKFTSIPDDFPFEIPTKNYKKISYGDYCQEDAPPGYEWGEPISHLNQTSSEDSEKFQGPDILALEPETFTLDIVKKCRYKITGGAFIDGTGKELNFMPDFCHCWCQNDYFEGELCTVKKFFDEEGPTNDIFDDPVLCEANTPPPTTIFTLAEFNMHPDQIVIPGLKSGYARLMTVVQQWGYPLNQKFINPKTATKVVMFQRIWDGKGNSGGSKCDKIDSNTMKPAWDNNGKQMVTVKYEMLLPFIDPQALQTVWQYHYALLDDSFFAEMDPNGPLSK